MDKGVQCNEQFNLYNAFNVSTSLHHLKRLIDKLKTTLDEEQSKKIMNDMEIKLFEITTETEKSNFTVNLFSHTFLFLPHLSNIHLGLYRIMKYWPYVLS